MFQLEHFKDVNTAESLLVEEHEINRAGIALVGTLGGAGLTYLLALCVVPFLRTHKKVRWWNNCSLMTAVGALISAIGFLGLVWSKRTRSVAWSNNLLAKRATILYAPIPRSPEMTSYLC